MPVIKMATDKPFVSFQTTVKWSEKNNKCYCCSATITWGDHVVAYTKNTHDYQIVCVNCCFPDLSDKFQAWSLRKFRIMTVANTARFDPWMDSLKMRNRLAEVFIDYYWGLFCECDCKIQFTTRDEKIAIVPL